MTSSSLPLVWRCDGDGPIMMMADAHKRRVTHHSPYVRKNTGFPHHDGMLNQGCGVKDGKSKNARQTNHSSRQNNPNLVLTALRRRAGHGRAGRQTERRSWRKKRARLHPGGFRAGARERASSRTPRTINKKLHQRRQRLPPLLAMTLPDRRLTMSRGREAQPKRKTAAAGAWKDNTTATATSHQATAASTMPLPPAAIRVGQESSRRARLPLLLPSPQPRQLLEGVAGRERSPWR